MTGIQRPLFALPGLGGQVVNVASVPQRSPLRYPGGKTWLVPYIRQWLYSRQPRPKKLIEPFAGGASVGLTAAFEDLADQVVLVELDEQVAAVWQVALSDEGQALAERIARFVFTPLHVEQALSTPALTPLDRAFQTILKNRVNRGGILAPGAGRVKHGEAGKGLQSRWYPETLKKRLLNITAHRHRLTFVQDDGLAVLRQYAQCAECVFFVDPPYTAGGKRAGSRLYTHAEIDHALLFRLVADLAGDFLMTYDDAPEVRALAHQHGLAVQTVSMKSTHHQHMVELLIGRDLRWLR